MKTEGMTLQLMSRLAIAAATPQGDAIQNWVSEYWPKLLAEAKTLQAEGWDYQSLGALATTTMQAAQALKGVFKGTTRAEIAQVVFVAAVKAALPDDYEHWIVPLLESPVVAGLIESAWRRVFGPDGTPASLPAPAGEAPVVEAPELPEGGVQ